MSERRGKRWALADVLDYETLLERDDASGPEVRVRADREWFRGYKGPDGPRYILRDWLDFHRERTERPLPGTMTARVYRVMALAAGALGLIAGAGLGWAILAYGGDQPVNLGVALTALVGGPAMFSAVSALLMAIPIQGGAPRVFERLARMVRFGVSVGRRVGLLDRAQADMVAGSVSRFSGRAGPYGGLLRWLVVTPVQARAASFQLGILAAVWWRGVVQDLAFAWQTTVQVSPERIHALARGLALPWRALIPPPTLEQVAGSRIVLKEGMAELSNADMAVWWPYMVCAVLCYGFLPRAALLLWALVGRLLSLAHLSFGDASSRRLLLELRSPQVSAVGHEPGREAAGNAGDGGQTDGSHQGATVTVLVPEARADLHDLALWQRVLVGLWGAGPAQVVTVTQDDEDDVAVLKPLGRLSGDAAVLVVFEGWRPFTTAAGLFVAAVREHTADPVPVIVGLAGRPDGPQLKQEDETTAQWRRMLRASGHQGGCDVVLLREGQA